MGTEVKICGMTRGEDVRAALDEGADYVGFVVYARSPRGITATRMRRVLESLTQPCRAVGVFVNEPPAIVRKVAEDCNLYAVQLHGEEAVEAFASFPGRLWRALRIATTEPGPAEDDWPAERYVLDAAVPGMYGGTGVCVDWEIAAAFARRHPVMLAGGLHADNIVRAVERVRPAGVDVASGVEREPGRKDHAKMALLIERVKHVHDIEG